MILQADSHDVSLVKNIIDGEFVFYRGKVEAIFVPPMDKRNDYRGVFLCRGCEGNVIC